MSLPYHYSLRLEIDIVGDGTQAHGDGAKATADRLANLIRADEKVIMVGHFPDLAYRGRYRPREGESA